jgi:hypothetical protein
MDISVRWITVNGRRLVCFTVPGNRIIAIPPDEARQLIADITRVLMSTPPAPGDNDSDGH